MRRGENHDAEPAQDPGDLRLAGIDPQPRLADAAQPGERLAARGLGLERNVDLLPLLTLADLEAGNVALVLEHARDLGAHARGGHRDPRVPGAVRVTDPGQHVGDSVCAHDALLTTTPS